LRSSLSFFITVILLFLSCSKESSTESTPTGIDSTFIVQISASEGGTVSTSGGKYNKGVKLTVTATPGSEYVFDRWSDGSTDNPREITVSSNLNLVANFIKKQYELILSIEGQGSIQEEILVAGSTSSNNYNSGSTIRLTATADPEWVFYGWSGDIDTADNPIELSINETKSVTAVFKLKNYDLTINVEGEGSVTETLVTSPTTSYESGSVVRLEASPSEGWRFTQWEGAISSEENPVDIEITESIQVTANFERINSEIIVLDDNGITLKAQVGAIAGDTQEIEGVLYTVVDEELLREMIDNFEDVSTAVTTLVTSMDNLFKDNYEFNQSIGHWDTSNVTSMRNLFFGATSFDQDISNWDVGAVTDFSGTFYGAEKFNHSLNSWDTSSAIKMGWMFNEAIAFNQPIAGWNVSSVENMDSMFRSASLFNQDLSSWCVSNLAEKPNEFDQGADSWELSQPIWGTCPLSDDSDLDGIVDYFDECPETESGDVVDQYGCSDRQKTGKYQLTLSVSGSGTITQERIINSSITDYDFGTTLKLTAVPTLGWEFMRWEGEIDSEENPLTIDLNRDFELTAIFQQSNTSVNEFDYTLSFFEIPEDQNFEHVFFRNVPGWNDKDMSKLHKKIILSDVNGDVVNEVIYDPKDQLLLKIPLPENQTPHELTEYLYYEGDDRISERVFDNFDGDPVSIPWNHRYHYELEFSNPVFGDSEPIISIKSRNNSLILVDKEVPVLRVGVGTLGFAPDSRYIYLNPDIEEYPLRLYFDTYYIDKLVTPMEESTTIVYVNEDDVQINYPPSSSTDLWGQDLIYSPLKEIYDDGSNILPIDFLNAFKNEANRLGISLGQDPVINVVSTINRDGSEYLAITDNLCGDDIPVITISSSFFDLSFGQQVAVIFHEFGHAYFSYDHESFGLMMSNVSISQYRNYTAFKNELSRFFNFSQHQIIDCGGNSRPNFYSFEGQKLNKIFFKL